MSPRRVRRLGMSAMLMGAGALCLLAGYVVLGAVLAMVATWLFVSSLLD